MLNQYARRDLSLVRVSYGLTVEDLFGLPYIAAASSVKMSVVRDAFSVSAIGGTGVQPLSASGGHNVGVGALAPANYPVVSASAPDTRHSTPATVFTFINALVSSVLGANSLQQSLGGSAISPARLFQTASNAATPLITLQPATDATGNPTGAPFTAAVFDGLALTLTLASRNTILDFLNLGYTVTFPRDPVTWGGLTRDPLLVVDPVTGDNGLFLVASGYADNLVSGSELLIATPQLTVPQLLADTAPAAPAGLCSAAADWLTALPDSTTVTGIAYVPAICHIKNLLGGAASSTSGGLKGQWSSSGGTGAAPLCLSSLNVATAAIALIGRIDAISAQPAIVNVTSGPHTFSPNGDGQQDTFNLAAACPRTASWTVTFRDTQGSEVRTFAPADNLAPDTNNSSRVNLAWDGRDELAALLPDGRYSYTLTAAGPGGSASVSNAVVLDNTLPTAAIAVQVRSSGGATAFAFSGAASDANFESYFVDLVDAGSGALVKTLFSGNIPVSASFGVVPSTSLVNGAYVAKLGVLDTAGNVATAQTAAFTVNNVIPDTTPPAIAVTSAVTDPNAGALSGTVPVQVTATDAGGIASVELLLDGASVAQTATSPLEYSIVCSTLADGPHTLYAVAADTAGNLAETESYVFLTSSPISGFIVTPSVATQAQPTLTISATLKQSAAWTLSFTGPAAIPDVAGTGTAVSAQLAATGRPDGDYTVTLTVAGLAETPQRGFTIDLVDFAPVGDIALDAGPVFADGSLPAVRVTEGLLDLNGTANDPDADDTVSWHLALYDLDGVRVKDFTPQPVDATGFHIGRAPAGSRLATLDFTLVRNGVYTLRLDVKGGNATASDEVHIALDSQLKVGQFSFSQQDLLVPVSGMPISVIRTYNSLAASSSSSSSDFGPGWSYAIADMAVELDETRGLDFDEEGNDFEVRTGGGRNVTLDLPDGRRVTFTYGIRRGSLAAWAEWTAPPGVYATLVPTCSNRIEYFPWMHWEASDARLPLESFDFPGFVLTLKDGTVYRLGRGTADEHFQFDPDTGENYPVTTYGPLRLDAIEQPNGDELTFHRAADTARLTGIQHANRSGDPTRSLALERQAVGGLSVIGAAYAFDQVDTSSGTPQPAAGAIPHVRYEYEVAAADGLPNLTAVHRLARKGTDIASSTWETTRYVYGGTRDDGQGHIYQYPPHYISRIQDPRGIAPMKTLYDEAGRVIGTVDAFGNEIILDHNLADRTETVYDRLGNPTIHVYDAKGNVTETMDAQGNRTSRTYDANGNELSVTDALGRTTASTYDGQGNRTSVTDALGHTTSYTFDGRGNQTSVTDPLGNVTHNEYDAAGNLVATVNALGQRTQNRYDASGNLSATVDALGNVTATFGYNANGDMTSTTDANGVTRSFGHDAAGRQTDTSVTVNGEPVVTSTLYDEAGRVIETVDADGKHSFTEYNAIGKPCRTTDKLGNVTETLYDARGNVVETRYPDGTYTRTVYDANGRTLATVARTVPGRSANGSRTVYDSVGRAVRSERLANVVISLVEDPVGSGAYRSEFVGADAVISATATRYDAAGRVIESTAADGAVTRYEYDAAGKQTAVIDALGNRTEYECDNAGRQTLVRDALGHETQFVYDALGRRVQTVFADGTAMQTTYDQLGRRVAETDQAGVTRDFEYDQQGRFVAVVLPEVPDPENGNAATRPRYEYDYDAYGRLVVIRDAKGRETTFTHDRLSRQLTRTLPLGQTESQAYNDLGQLTHKADFKTQVTEFLYDTLGRVNAKRLYASGADVPPAVPPLETITFNYDNLGRQHQIVETRGVTEFTYDQDSRVTEVASPEGTIRYAYDPVTGRKERTFTANNDTRYAYDVLGRLVAVAVHEFHDTILSEPLVTTYAHTATGARESQVLPNGITTLYEYDSLNRLTNLSHFNAGDELLASYNYTLAATGRRVGVVEKRREDSGVLSTNTIEYTFDQLNRLTQEHASSTTNAIPSFMAQYTYDLVGNRLSKTFQPGPDNPEPADAVAYSYDANDRLLTEASTASGTTTYGFSDNGEMVSKTGPGETCNYTYNLEGKLSGATITRNEAGHAVDVTAAYQYNQRGFRVRRQSTTRVDGGAVIDTSRTYLLDEHNLTGYSQTIEESDVGGLARSFAIGDTILTQADSTGTRCLLPDAHSSTRLLTDAVGLVTDRFSLDAWGLMLHAPGPVYPTATDILYTGQYLDDELDLQYNRARWYDQRLGGFTSMDTFAGTHEQPQSLHKLGYCHGDPVNGVDPFGEFTMLEMLVVVGVFASFQSSVAFAGPQPGNTFNFTKPEWLMHKRYKDLEAVKQLLKSEIVGREIWRRFIRWNAYRATRGQPYQIMMSDALGTRVRGLIMYMHSKGDPDNWPWRQYPTEMLEGEDRSNYASGNALAHELGHILQFAPATYPGGGDLLNMNPGFRTIFGPYAATWQRMPLDVDMGNGRVQELEHAVYEMDASMFYENGYRMDIGLPLRLTYHGHPFP